MTDKTIEEMFSKLDEDEQAIVHEVAAAIIKVLSSENGAAVVMVDHDGGGRCDVLTCGNEFIVGSLLASAKRLSKAIDPVPEVLQ